MESYKRSGGFVEGGNILKQGRTLLIKASAHVYSKQYERYMTKYRITIHREPFGKEEKRVTRRGSFSHSYMPEKSRDWMNLIRMTFIEKYGQVMYAGGIKMQIEAYYPIKGSYKHEANVRKNVSKAVKEKMLLNEIRPLVKPDNSNVLKLIEDGLSNACYVDDSQIIENTIKKYFCSKPRLEIYLETV